MELRETYDGRDRWAQARRVEIFRYAQELGVTEFTDSANGIPPKDVMVKRLKQLGHPPPTTPPRTIGCGPRAGDTNVDSHHFKGAPTPATAETVQVNAVDLLEQEWVRQAAQTPPPPSPKAIAEMSINELRDECKRLSIKMERRDNMIRLREKITAHGQNAT